MMKLPLNKKGQVAVWVMLISVVGLTLGLSIASRTLSNLRQSSELEEANRAFTAAEAGIEDALYILESTGTVADTTSPVSMPESGSSYEYDVTEGGGGAELILSAPLEKDMVYQVDATNMTGDVIIYWVDNDNSDQTANRASVAVTLISRETVNNYLMEKYAYNPSTNLGRANGFDSSSGGAGFQTIGGIDFAEWTGNIAIPGTSSAVNPVQKIIRIRAMYNDTAANTVALRALNGTFPTQFHTITSTGTHGNVERAVQVTRSKPALPGFFDFVLSSLSAGGLSK